MLLKPDRPNPALAKEALETAIAVARRQAARSFELRAALSLAKLCLSTGHAADAQAVLAPALEGFAPTPEMLEIAEAQALLERLAHGGEGQDLTEADPLTADDPAAGAERNSLSAAGGSVRPASKVRFASRRAARVRAPEDRFGR
jgi:hypothetical protein